MGGYATGVAAKEGMAALCDVDEARAAKHFKKFPDVPKFKDFRVMLDKMADDIDAVAISTPDHTQFAAAMAAMERGKHVFVQKPLAHDIWQCRTLRKAAKHYKVVTQMGNQGHTFEGMRRIKEWTDAGIIGDVKEVITWTNRPNAPWFVPPSQFPPKSGPAPSTLDWDLWQGPAKKREYSADYVPTRWRGWWDYGCGALGDIGCHTFDAPFYVLGLGSPTKVEVDRVEPPGPGFIPMGSVVTYHFPARGDKPPVTLKWFEGPTPPKTPEDFAYPIEPGGGLIMVGEKGGISHGARAKSPKLYPEERWEAYRKDPEAQVPKTLPRVKGGLHADWVSAIKEGRKACSDFSYAGPLTELILLGTLAVRTGKGFKLDGDAMKILGNPEAAALVKVEARPGWDIKDLA